jgi:hypothetical protein
MSANDIFVTLEEAQPIDVTIEGYSYVDRIDVLLKEYLIDEVPVKVNNRRFRTSIPYWPTRLKVFLNGIKEKYITPISDTEFEFTEDVVTSDIIEVEYIKKVE